MDACSEMKIKTNENMIEKHKKFWTTILCILAVEMDYIYTFFKCMIGGDALHAKAKLIMVGKNGKVVGSSLVATHLCTFLFVLLFFVGLFIA